MWLAFHSTVCLDGSENIAMRYSLRTLLTSVTAVAVALAFSTFAYARYLDWRTRVHVRQELAALSSRPDGEVVYTIQDAKVLYWNVRLARISQSERQSLSTEVEEFMLRLRRMASSQHQPRDQ